MYSTDSENLLANCVIPSMETPTPSLELDDVFDGLHDASACVCLCGRTNARYQALGMTTLNTNYGTPAEVDLLYVLGTLSTKFSTVSSFPNEASRSSQMKLTFLKLQRFGQELSPILQMQYL